MYINVYQTQDDLFKAIVTKLNEEISNQHISKIGLATGKTMVPIYREWVNNPPKSHSSIKWFILDEFANIPKNHPDSYEMFLENHLWSHLKISNDKKIMMKDDPNQYEIILKENGFLDLQFLGIGLNGHVGLNEPGVDPSLGTHFHDLTTQTQQVHLQSAIDKSYIPKKAMTQGISTLLKHKKLWLIAWGKSKSTIIEKFLSENESNQNPATLLRNHPDLSLFLDSDAYSLVKKQIS